MAKTYALVVGVVLLIWGVVGLFTSSFLGIATTGLQVWLFIIAGVLGLWMALANKGLAAYAKTFGVVFTLGGILGFILPGVMEALTLDTSVIANLVHLVAGLWGLWAGFGKRGGSSPMPASNQPMGGGSSM